jgi:hypothetical protein
MSAATDTDRKTGRVDPGRSRWLTVLAAGFLLLLVVGSLVVVLWPEQESAAPGGSDVPSSPATGVPAAGPTAVPTTAPAGVTWELVSGMAVPVSETAGPVEADGPVRKGFAHTPEGALIAALHIFGRATLSPGDGWREVTLEQVMPGTGRDVYVDAREKVSSVQPPPGGWGQAVGFRFQSYTAEEAVIDVARKFQNGNLQVSQTTVVWHEGDWRLQLQPDGDTGPYTASVRDLSGFVEFSSGV